MLDLTSTEVAFTLTILIGSEVLFYMYVAYLATFRLQVKAKEKPFQFKNPADMIRDIYTMCSSLESYDLEDFFSGFCLMSKFEDIYTINCEMFLAWAVYTSRIDELNEEQKGVVRELRIEASKYLKTDFIEGYNPNVKTTGFHLEPVSYLHHPLCLTILFATIDKFSDFYYLYTFKKIKTNGGMDYWFKEGSKMKAPVFIFHGVFSGWGFFSQLIEAINQDRTVILFNYLPVKIGILPSPSAVPGPLEINETFVEIMGRHNIKKVAIIAHSWGTFIAGWIVRLNPEFVCHLSLIDPIALTVVLPETTYALLYEPPNTLMKYLMFYFVRNDLNLSYTLRRYFAWYNAALRLDDVPAHIGVFVCIATNDELLRAATVYELCGLANEKRQALSLSATGKVESVKRILWNNCMHGDAIVNKACIKDIKNAIYEFENQEKSLYTGI